MARRYFVSGFFSTEAFPWVWASMAATSAHISAIRGVRTPAAWPRLLAAHAGEIVILEPVLHPLCDVGAGLARGFLHHLRYAFKSARSQSRAC